MCSWPFTLQKDAFNLTVGSFYAQSRKVTSPPHKRHLQTNWINWINSFHYLKYQVDSLCLPSAQQNLCKITTPTLLPSKWILLCPSPRRHTSPRLWKKKKNYLTEHQMYPGQSGNIPRASMISHAWNSQKMGLKKYLQWETITQLLPTLLVPCRYARNSTLKEYFQAQNLRTHNSSKA